MALFNDDRLLFFDHEHIGCMEEVGLTMNPPIKRGACLYVEREWELGDSDRVQGNNTEFVLSWKGKSDLSRFVGKRIKLLLKSRHAKLFAVYP